MMHGSTFVEQQMLQMPFNKCWTVYHVMLNVDICRSTCWKLLNENRAWLYSVQQVAETMVNIFWLTKVERCWTVYHSLKSQLWLRQQRQLVYKKTLDNVAWGRVCMYVCNFTEVQVSQVIIVFLLQNCFVWYKDHTHQAMLTTELLQWEHWQLNTKIWMVAIALKCVSHRLLETIQRIARLQKHDMK